MATTHGYYQRMQLYVLAIMRALAASHKAAITNRRKHAKGLYKAIHSSLKEVQRPCKAVTDKCKHKMSLEGPSKTFRCL